MLRASPRRICVTASLRIRVGVSDFSGVRYTYAVCPGAFIQAGRFEAVNRVNGNPRTVGKEPFERDASEIRRKNKFSRVSKVDQNRRRSSFNFFCSAVTLETKVSPWTAAVLKIQRFTTVLDTYWTVIRSGVNFYHLRYYFVGHRNRNRSELKRKSFEIGFRQFLAGMWKWFWDWLCLILSDRDLNYWLCKDKPEQ